MLTFITALITRTAITASRNTLNATPLGAETTAAYLRVKRITWTLKWNTDITLIGLWGTLACSPSA